MQTSVAGAVRRFVLPLASALLAGILAGSAYAQAPAKTLTVASYGGFLDTVMKEIFEPFEERHGLKIRWVPGASAENVAKAAAARGSSEYDIILTDMITHRLGVKHGLFAPIDEKIVTAYADLYPQAKPPSNDAAVIGFYFTGLFFNPKEFEKRGWAPPKKWTDLLRPEFCKQIGFLHPNVSYGLHSVLMFAGGNPAKMSDGVAVLEKIKDCITVLEPSAAKLEEKIQLGEYLVGANGSIRVIPLIRRGYPVAFVFPEEGSILGGGVVTVSKTSANPQLSQEFVNWLISPPAQKTLMERSFYGPTNRKVVITEEFQKLGVPSPEQIAKLIHIDEDLQESQRRNWIRQIERAVSR